MVRQTCLLAQPLMLLGLLGRVHMHPSRIRSTSNILLAWCFWLIGSWFVTIGPSAAEVARAGQHMHAGNLVITVPERPCPAPSPSCGLEARVPSPGVRTGVAGWGIEETGAKKLVKVHHWFKDLFSFLQKHRRYGARSPGERRSGQRG